MLKDFKKSSLLKSMLPEIIYSELVWEFLLVFFERNRRTEVNLLAGISFEGKVLYSTSCPCWLIVKSI